MTVTRRTFIKGGLILGAAALSGQGLVARPAEAKSVMPLSHFKGPVVAAVTGSDYFENTRTALEQLGGMSRFVPKGAKVGVLINHPFTNPGTHVSPDVSLAVIKMCFEAGAGQVQSLKNPPAGYWQRAKHIEDCKDVLNRVIPFSEKYQNHRFKDTPALKEAEIVQDIFNVDIFINVAVVKHAIVVQYSGSLKNLMGLCPSATCRRFHTHFTGQTAEDDLDFLSQCIVDLNQIRKPDLCIMDASEFITTNGPFGPGNLSRPQKVAAGTDRVAMDAWGVTLLGHQPTDIMMIGKAAKIGLGEMDLKKILISETTL